MPAPLHAQPRPRVDGGEDQVDEEVRGEHSDDDEDEDALQQEVVPVGDRLVEQVAEARVLERDLGDDVAADDHAELQRQPGQLRQRRVPVGVPADHALPRAKRPQVAGAVVLQLVDDQVAHADRPAAEADDEDREERQEPVGEQRPDERPGPRRQQVQRVTARHREHVPDDGQEVGDDQGNPRVGHRLEQVARGKHRVVECLAPGRRGAEPVAEHVRKRDGRDEQGERVRQRLRDQRVDLAGEVRVADPQVAGEYALPVVQVLLPERQVGAEGLGHGLVERRVPGGLQPEG
jgi:hypothetical protein